MSEKQVGNLIFSSISYCYSQNNANLGFNLLCLFMNIWGENYHRLEAKYGGNGRSNSSQIKIWGERSRRPRRSWWRMQGCLLVCCMLSIPVLLESLQKVSSWNNLHTDLYWNLSECQHFWAYHWCSLLEIWQRNIIGPKIEPRGISNIIIRFQMNILFSTFSEWGDFYIFFITD